MLPDPTSINFGFCVECRDLFHDGCFVGDSLVCQACAPFAREKVKCNVPLGRGPWHRRNRMVVAADTVLPTRCWGCAHSTEKTLKLSRGCFLGSPLHPGRYSVELEVPLCHRCFKKQLWRQMATVPIILLALACFVGGEFMWNSWLQWPLKGTGIAFGILLWWLSWKYRVGRMKRVDKCGHLWLCNIAPALIAALPPLPEEYWPDSFWEELRQYLFEPPQ